MYSQRDFLNEICRERGIALTGYSGEYVLRLAKDGRTRGVFGAYWDINSAAADRIACDKTACYELLKAGGVPAIEHVLFNNPLVRLDWAKPEGSWATALRVFGAFGGRAVLKPNQGTRGADVFYCDTIPKMEAAAHAIFAGHSAAAISPFAQIRTEYRVFHVCGKCPFVYGKVAGESWQHNLAKGAKAVELSVSGEEEKQLLRQLKSVAARAAECIGINFATVDIAKTHGGELRVIEINSGVQARLLLEQRPHLREKIKKVYGMAIDAMMGGGAERC